MPRNLTASWDAQAYVLARLRLIGFDQEADEAEAAWSHGKGWLPGSDRIIGVIDEHQELGVWIDFANFQATRD